MRRRAFGLAIVSLVALLGARAGADEPAACTCEVDVVCPTVVPPEPLMPYAPPPAVVAPPPEPAPKYHYFQKTRPRWGMIGGGIGLFLNAWLTPAIAGGVIGYGKLAIPVAGPILFATDRAWGAWPAFAPYIVVDVLAQATGLVIAAIGLFTTEKVYGYERISFAPTVTPTFAGLAASGRF
jgi:hypothetical protein